MERKGKIDWVVSCKWAGSSTVLIFFSLFLTDIIESSFIERYKISQMILRVCTDENNVVGLLGRVTFLRGRRPSCDLTASVVHLPIAASLLVLARRDDDFV